MPPSVFSQLLQEAQRAARRRLEAEDLFQTVWLAAVEAGRGTSPARSIAGGSSVHFAGAPCSMRVLLFAGGPVSSAPP